MFCSFALLSASHFGNFNLDRITFRNSFERDVFGVGLETAIKSIQDFQTLLHIFNNSRYAETNNAVGVYGAMRSLWMRTNFAGPPGYCETDLRICLYMIQFFPCQCTVEQYLSFNITISQRQDVRHTIHRKPQEAHSLSSQDFLHFSKRFNELLWRHCCLLLVFIS